MLYAICLGWRVTDDVLLITVSAYVGTGTWVVLTIDEVLEFPLKFLNGTQLIHFILQ